MVRRMMLSRTVFVAVVLVALFALKPSEAGAAEDPPTAAQAQAFASSSSSAVVYDGRVLTDEEILALFKSGLQDGLKRRRSLLRGKDFA